MKSRPTQFGARENTVSSQRHAPRLAYVLTQHLTYFMCWLISRKRTLDMQTFERIASSLRLAQQFLSGLNVLTLTAALQQRCERSTKRMPADLLCDAQSLRKVPHPRVFCPKSAESHENKRVELLLNAKECASV
jgi:hypothetical protein